jgi:hypothetical protein
MKTKLNVLNAALEAISHPPVGSTTGGSQAVELIMQMIERTALDTQRLGWSFNTEYDLELVPDGTTKEIDVGPSILAASWESSRHQYPDLVLRATRLFNRQTNTYQFDAPVRLTVVRELVWEETPAEFREFVEASVRRQAYQNIVGSSELFSVLARDEALARSRLETAQSGAAHNTLFSRGDIFPFFGSFHLN